MYLKWDEKVITDFSDKNINDLYDQGYLFGRVEKGEIYQTRSLRIDLSKFKLSSENKRVLKKTEELQLAVAPLPYADYHWSIGKLGKDFYETKFGEGTFSANKIKELLTDPSKSNFNKLFIYERASSVILSPPTDMARLPASGGKNPLNTNLKGSFAPTQDDNVEAIEKIGYCIALETSDLIHYCYPFYKLPTKTPPTVPPLIGEGGQRIADTHLADSSSPYKGEGGDGGFNHIPNLGLGMMLRAILYAQEQDKKYIYLGSFQRPTDTYKLQFEGLEWFDGKSWQTEVEKLKSQPSFRTLAQG